MGAPGTDLCVTTSFGLLRNLASLMSCCCFPGAANAHVYCTCAPLIHSSSESVCLSCSMIWGILWSVPDERSKGGGCSQGCAVLPLLAITQHNSSVSRNTLVLLSGRQINSVLGHSDRCPVTERLLHGPLWTCFICEVQAWRGSPGTVSSSHKLAASLIVSSFFPWTKAIWFSQSINKLKQQ